MPKASYQERVPVRKTECRETFRPGAHGLRFYGTGEPGYPYPGQHTGDLPAAGKE